MYYNVIKIVIQLQLGVLSSSLPNVVSTEYHNPFIFVEKIIQNTIFNLHKESHI